MGVRKRQRKKSMKTLVLPLLMVHLCSALSGSHVKVSIGGVSYSHGNKVDSPFHSSFPAFKTKTVANLNASQNQPSSSRVNTLPTSPVTKHVTPGAPAAPTTPTTPSTPSTATTPTTPTSTLPTPTHTPTKSSPSTLATIYFTSSPSQQPEKATVHQPDAPHSRITPILKNHDTVYKSSIRIVSVPETTIAQASQTVSKFGTTLKFHDALQYQSTPGPLQQTRKASLLKMLKIFQNKSQTRRRLSKKRKTHKYKTISQNDPTPKYNAAHEYKTTLKYNAELDYSTTPNYDAALKYNTTPKHPATLEYNTISFDKAELEYQTTPQPKQQTTKTRLEKIREIFDKYAFYNHLKTEEK